MSRAWRSLRVLLRFRLFELVRLLELPWWGRLLYTPFRLVERLTPTPSEPLETRLRLAIESLGPVFVKFGQILSTRRDLLAEPYAEELALLQDAVPPFSSEVAEQIICSELGQSISGLFTEFNSEAMASASVAQVHAAVLPDGSPVCVKVLRPNIDVVIKQDLILLHEIASFINKVSAEGRRLRLPEVVRDYDTTINNELDLDLEAANTIRLRLDFAESELLYVPKVHAELSTPKVLTLERIFAASMGDVAAIRAAGTNMAKLAERGVETFFTQVFENNFFHADMHPGNIFVDISNPDDPSWIAIDCAIMGELSRSDRLYLARSLLAFLNRDYRGVARLQLESGWVPANTDLDALTEVVEYVCEPVFNKPLAEIEFGPFLVTLFAAAQQFDLQVQPQLVLLQKTLLNIEGLGRQLYPQLDLWVIAKPFMERWMTAQLGPETTIERLASRMPELLRQLPTLPDLLVDADFELKHLKQMSLQQHARLNALQAQSRRRSSRLLGGGVIALAGLILLLGPLSASLAESNLVWVGLVALVIGGFVAGRNG